MNQTRKYDKSYCIIFFVILVLMTSIYLSDLSIDMGFSLKPYMMVAVLAIILYYLILNEKHNFRILMYEKIFILLYMYMVVNGIFSKYAYMSLRMIINISLAMIMYIVSTDYLNHICSKKIINLTIISGSIFVVISLVLYLLKFSIAYQMDRGMCRLNGMVSDTNVYALFATPIFLLLLYKILNKEYKYIPMFCITLISIVFTFSRGGTLGIVTGTLILIIKNIRKESFKNKIFRYIIFVVAIIILFIITNQISIKFLGISLNKIIEGRIEDSGGSGRVDIWIRAINIFKQNPIFGIGIFNFQGYNLYYFNDYHHIHNTFLEMMVENGIVGFIIFTTFLISFFLNESVNEESCLFKIIILSLIVELIFLSGISFEIMYIMFAVYKVENIKKIRDW
ncbi:O-antigen ligase family protein [Terrisporobacter sp.]